MDPRLRRALVALLPYALAVAVAYGTVASALAVPLAHLDRMAAYTAGVGRPDPAPHEGADHDVSAVASARSDLGACHAPAARRPALVASSGTEPSGGAPGDDHFECCITRVGTVGSANPAAVVAQRHGEGRRLGRAPRPRMPARPRPWRVSLGRHPPVRAHGMPLVA